MKNYIKKKLEEFIIGTVIKNINENGALRLHMKSNTSKNFDGKKFVRDIVLNSIGAR